MGSFVSDIAFELKGLLKILTSSDDQSGVVVTTRFDEFTVTAKPKGQNMAYTLPVDRKVGVKISYVDSKGNPASVDGDVRWEESDKSIFLFQVNPNDSFQGTIMPQGSLGLAQLKAMADADLGEGVKPLITLFDLEVVGGEAVAGVIAPVGEPEPAAAAGKKK